MPIKQRAKPKTPRIHDKSIQGTRKFVSKDITPAPQTLPPSQLSKTRGISVVAKDHSGSLSRVRLYNKMIAVVIGIDAYKDLPPRDHLSYAVKDAKGVESVLHKNYQFDRIITLYNREATRDNIMEVLQGELATTGSQDAVFVYFAGHGITRPIQTGEGELGYLIPYDGSLERAGMHRNISMQQIKADVCPLAPAKHVFFVMDACFGGLLLDQRAVDVKPGRDEAYLREITEEHVRQVLTAGQADETVLDGGSRGHSVFTGRFIEALEEVKDYVTARQLIARVSKEVYGDAATRGHKQRPRGGEIYGTGDFVFVSNYEQRLQDRLMASQVEVKRARERKEELSHTYARLIEDERTLKKRIQGQKDAAQDRQVKREKAILEAKKRAYELEKASVEDELRKKEASQAALEKRLQEQAKIQGTMKDLEQDLAKSYREIEDKKRLELAAIQRDKAVELLRVKRLMEDIQKKRESLKATKLETLSIGDAMQEYKNVEQQLAAVSSKYDKRLAGGLKDLEKRYDNQRQRYLAEIEKLDKVLLEYEEQINGITRKYYNNPPKKDMFETQDQFQQRLAVYKKQADGQAVATRKNFESGLNSIKAQREKLSVAKSDLTNQYEMEKGGFQNRILAEKETEMEIYRQQLDGIVNQAYILPIDEIELGKYLPEHQVFQITAFIQVNRQKKGVSFRLGIPGKEARMLWNNREFIRGEAVLKLKPASDEVTVISIDIIDDVHSKKYSHDVVMEVGRDDCFIAYANGLVKDTNTGLEWKTGPDQNTNWDEARSWVQSLNLDGGGWRMPTTDELQGLYKKGMRSHNLTSLLLNTTYKYLYVWSGETKGSSDARLFAFRRGLRHWLSRDDSFNLRAFAVRSRSDG
ncbi:MAG: caspase family protein [Desulfobacteraceae bacterium]|nr:caspase family protein [Desulfobacteraceae bacterium]